MILTQQSSLEVSCRNFFQRHRDSALEGGNILETPTFYVSLELWKDEKVVLHILRFFGYFSCTQTTVGIQVIFYYGHIFVQITR